MSKRHLSSRPRNEVELALRLKSFFGENDQLEPGDSERADRLCRMEAGADATCRIGVCPRGHGAGRGVVNLCLGFIVFRSVARIEFKEALLFLELCSTGTQSVLTVCPGRYGQWFVVDSVGSCVSVVPSSSY